MKKHQLAIIVAAIFITGFVLPQAGAVFRTFNQHAPESELQISFGNFTNASAFAKQGQNPDIDMGVAEDLWEQGGLFVFPAAAELLDVVSTSTDDAAAGTGARTITIEGLDANFLEIVEIVTMNGTTPVPTVAAFLRVNKAFVSTAGSTKSNVGTLTADNTTSSNVLINMRPTDGISMSSIFTVPAGKRLLVTSFFASIGSTAAATATAQLIAFDEVGGAEFVVHTGSMQVSGSTHITGFFTPAEMFEGKTSLRLKLLATANNTDVIGGYDGYLVTVEQ